MTQARNFFGRRDNDPQHAFLRMMSRQISLLDPPQRDTRRCVAGKNDQLRAGTEEFDHSFECVAIDGLEAARAVRRPRIVAEIECRITGQTPANLSNNAEAAES